jgi:hypothetical protein
MLKGIKIELVGIVLITILLITATTLSTGSVNAGPVKHSINGKVAGPAPNVTVDTPYGKVLVTPEYYKSVGEEQIIKDQKNFMELREQLIKMGFINTTRESTYTTSIPLTSQTNTFEPLTITTEQNPRNIERSNFTPKPGYSPNFLYGFLNPLPSTPSTLPSDIHETDEYELYPGGSNDCIEVISEHEGNHRDIQYAFYNGDPGGPQVYVNVFSNVDHGIEFYFNYNTALHRYETVFYDPVTQTTSQTYTYSDPYIGSYLSMILGSCELSYNTEYPSTFHTETIAEQWVTRSGSTYYNPSDIINYNGRYGDPVQYVDPLNVQQIYGHYIDTLKAGSDVI